MKLFIIPSWYPTKLNPASGLFFQERALLLKKSGIDVVVVAPVLHSFRNILKYKTMNQGCVNPIKEMPTFINEKMNIFPKNEKISFYRYQKGAISLFNQAIKQYGKPDMVLFNSSIWSGAALCQTLSNNKIPFIISEHLKEFLIPNGFSVFNRNLIQEAYSLCFKVIPTSSTLKNSITKNFKIDDNKITLIPNPVDESIFTLKPTSKRKSSISITIVALFRKEKNIDIMINAFNKILKSGINANLNIIGDGPLKSKIKKQIKNLKLFNKIKLYGYLSQDKIVKVLHQSDIFMLGSSVETFGVSLIEAQSCGLPAIATKCGGPNDIISKENGVLVWPNSESELTKGLQAIIKNIDLYNSKEIRNQTIERFGKNVYCQLIKDILLKKEIR